MSRTLADVATPEGIKDRLRLFGVRPEKFRGQNFLADYGAVQTVLEFSEVTQDEHVLEVGPGLGVLTQSLAHDAKSLRVIEIEEDFCRGLAQNIPELPADKIHCADVRKVNVEELLLKEGIQEKIVVVSNVPYSISTEFIEWLFLNSAFINRAQLLLQREFAARLGAGPGGRDYGSLSVFRERHADARLGAVLDGEMFHPKANVESQLLSLRFREPIPIPGVSEEKFQKFVRGAFTQRRKILPNSFAASGLFPNKDAARAFLVEGGIDPSRRAETVSLEEFEKLAIRFYGQS